MAVSDSGTIIVEPFWRRMAIGLSIFIVFGFLQFALRGFVDPYAAPFWVHVHGIAMLGWLALLIAQPILAARNNRALHRRLGWIDAGLAMLITGLGVFVGLASLMLHRQPPFFDPAYFLALTVVESLMFGLMVAWAIRRRRMTDWHSRLMIGAVIIILEPALGRLLPMPLMIGWSDIPVALCQLFAVAIVALHDRRTLGIIHPATKLVALIVVATRLAIYLLAMTPPVIEWAARLSS